MRPLGLFLADFVPQFRRGINYDTSRARSNVQP